MNVHIENKRLIKKNNKAIKTMIDLYNEKVELQDENKQLKNDLIRVEAMEDYWNIKSCELKEDLEELKKEIKHLKECNLRYRNHNELLESMIGIRNNVIE